jgi:hypothetical protein
MRYAWTLIPLAAVFLGQAEENVVRKPLAIGTKIETGKIQDGEPNQWVGDDPDDFYLSYIGVNLTQEVIVDQIMELKVGVGGVFFYSFPERRGNPGAQGTKFGPGVSQAQALFKFGDVEQPWGSLRIGYFPYKYNADAKNLGEYLFRSMPYPSVVTTGGWSITDNAQVRAQGLVFSISQLEGRLKHDFILVSERDYRPQGDFSPAYQVQATFGAFQFGAGFSLHHFLPINGQLSKSDIANAGKDVVVKYNAFPNFKAAQNQYKLDDVTGTPTVEDTIYHAAGQPLTATLTDMDGVVAENPQLTKDDQYRITDASNGVVYIPDTVYFTTQGIKLMARAAFDLQKLVPIDMLNPEDLKVYAEVAVLGLKNQPGYYEKLADRIPLMLGINLPTFRLLDKLSFEVEYFRNPMEDDLESMISKGNYNPIPLGSGVLFPVIDHKDDIKWSLYASRQIFSGFSLRAQIANDHFRAPQIAPSQHLFTSVPATRKISNFYYIVTLNFGI